MGYVILIHHRDDDAANRNAIVVRHPELSPVGQANIEWAKRRAQQLATSIQVDHVYLAVADRVSQPTAG
jgi:hypothetical protein